MRSIPVNGLSSSNSCSRICSRGMPGVDKIDILGRQVTHEAYSRLSHHGPLSRATARRSTSIRRAPAVLEDETSTQSRVTKSTFRRVSYPLEVSALDESDAVEVTPMGAARPLYRRSLSMSGRARTFGIWVSGCGRSVVLALAFTSLGF